MIAFGGESLEEALQKRIVDAVSLRKKLFDLTRTNAYRLINAEGDGLPGLIVDCYNDVLVLQASSPGVEKLKSLIVSHLVEACKPKAIFEKSNSSLRKREGLADAVSLIYGKADPEVEVLEEGLRYSVHVLEGQKTGLFLDQREMRAQIRALAHNQKVLNCFSYTGGFSISALAGGALSVDSVDVSAKCGPAIDRNLYLNDLPQAKHRFYAQDAIDFVAASKLDYGIVILDPPAFAKKREDIPKATHAYKKLNRAAMEKMAPGTILLTCSCSSQITEEMFQTLMFRAALESKRQVRILGRHRQGADHPISIFHPETSYLKALLLEVV